MFVAYAMSLKLTEGKQGYSITYMHHIQGVHFEIQSVLQPWHIILFSD